MNQRVTIAGLSVDRYGWLGVAFVDGDGHHYRQVMSLTGERESSLGLLLGKLDVAQYVWDDEGRLIGGDFDLESLIGRELTIQVREDQ